MSIFGTGSDAEGRERDVINFAGRDIRPILSRIEAYWENCRACRLVPNRTDIDPIGLEGVLGHVFIAERISTGLARFRIAGTHLTDLIGLDVRGMPISAIFNSADREILSDGLESVFDDPAVLHLTLDSPSGFRRNRLQGEMLMLPLRSDLGEISRALGVLVMPGDIGRTPRRFSISHQNRRGLTGYGGQEKTGAAAFKRVDTRKSPDATQQRTLSQHLRLVADNALDD